MRDRAEQRRYHRSLLGVLGATALVYPMLFCALRLAFAHLLHPDPVAVVLWSSIGVLCSTAAVAVARWGSERPVASPWLLLGLLPLALLELYLWWPSLTG